MDQLNLAALNTHPLVSLLIVVGLLAVGYFLGRQSVEGFSSGSSSKKRCERPLRCPPCPPQPDLSKYVLKSSIPPCPPLPDMSQYMRKTECEAKPDMSLYVLKSEVPPCPPCIQGCSKPCSVGKCPPCPRPRCPVVKPCPRTTCAPCPACPRPRCEQKETKCTTITTAASSGVEPMPANLL